MSTRRSKVDVFVVSRAADANGVAVPEGTREVEAATHDGLRAEAMRLLEGEGYRIRAVSFGPGGLVAYVEERA